MACMHAWFGTLKTTAPTKNGFLIILLAIIWNSMKISNWFFEIFSCKFNILSEYEIIIK